MDIADLLVLMRLIYAVAAGVAALWVSRLRFRADLRDALTIAFLGLAFAAVAPKGLYQYGLGVAIGAFAYAAVAWIEVH